MSKTAEQVAEIIDRLYDDYEPRYNSEGRCTGSNIVDALAEAGLIRPEALEKLSQESSPKP